MQKPGARARALVPIHIGLYIRCTYIIPLQHSTESLVLYCSSELSSLSRRMCAWPLFIKFRANSSLRDVALLKVIARPSARATTPSLLMHYSDGTCHARAIYSCWLYKLSFLPAAARPSAFLSPFFFLLLSSSLELMLSFVYGTLIK